MRKSWKKCFVSAQFSYCLNLMRYWKEMPESSKMFLGIALSKPFSYCGELQKIYWQRKKTSISNAHVSKNCVV